MQKAPYDIVIFLIVVSALIIFMVAFIVFMLYQYRKKQTHFQQSLEKIKLDHEKTLLGAQLEIQEQTFQKISREIHDNITLSLSLAKLDLHSINWNEKEQAIEKISNTTNLLSKSIAELSDISKSLDADIIKQQGLLSAIKDELRHIEQPGLFKINFKVDGEPVFLDSSKELIIFRIIQESFNNIIKHAAAKLVTLQFSYSSDYLDIIIKDDGKGFDKTQCPQIKQAGLKNMANRVLMLAGKMGIESQPGIGTTLSFTIPFE